MIADDWQVRRDRALEVKCPRCDAKPGDPCVAVVHVYAPGIRGKPLPLPHHARYEKVQSHA